MADTHTRQAKRTPVTLKIKFKSQTLDQFIERYSVDVSHGGIFIRTKDPLPVGTQMRFEFQLKDATPLIRGEGTVVWTREHDPSRAGVAPGMGVRFDRLIENSQEVLDKILAGKSAKQRGPGFNEVPTKVAPSPLVAGLSKEAKPTFGKMAPPRQSFVDERTDATPLPSPMPFHSDAEDFPEEAFEEATKVASLDALAARSAQRDGADDELFGAANALAGSAGDPALDEDELVSSARDELAARRAAKQAAERAAAEKAAAEKEAAEKEAAEKEAAEKEAAEKEAAAAAEMAAVEPKAAELKTADLEKRAAAAAATPLSPKKSTATEPARPAAGDHREDLAALPRARKGGGLGLIAAAAVLVAAVAFGGWWMFLRDKGEPKEASNQPPPTQAAASEPPAPEPPPAAAKPAPPETYKTTVAAKPAGAVAELVGSDGTKAEKKPTPATFELEKGRSYKVRVSAPGFVAQEVAITEGVAEQKTVVLAAMKRMLRISAEPEGTVVYVLGKVHDLPVEIEITDAIVKRKRLGLGFRKRGHKKLNQWVKVTADEFSEEGGALVQNVTATLTPVAVAARPTASRRGAAKPTGDDPEPKATSKDDKPDGTGEPKPDKPKADKADKPKADKDDKPKADEPKADKADKPKADKPKTDKADKPKADKADKPKADKADKPKADKPAPKPAAPAGPKPSWAQ